MDLASSQREERGMTMVHGTQRKKRKEWGDWSEKGRDLERKLGKEAAEARRVETERKLGKGTAEEKKRE